MLNLVFLPTFPPRTLIPCFSLASYHDGPDEIDTNDTVASRDHNWVSGVRGRFEENIHSGHAEPT